MITKKNLLLVSVVNAIIKICLGHQNQDLSAICVGSLYDNNTVAMTITPEM